MNWYSVFYWITVADGIKQFFDIASNIFSWFSAFSFVLLVITMIGESATISDNYVKTQEQEDTDADTRAWKRFRMYTSKIFTTMLILSLITWAGYVFCPSKKDALIIVAGGSVGNFITRDSSAKAIPSEVMTLLRDKIRAEIKEIHMESSMDSLKSLSKEQLIDYIKKQK